MTFSGNIEQDLATSPNQQDRLIYGKITNKQSCSGLSDITLLVQGKVVNEPSASVTLGAIVTVPTSSRPTGHYLFEPVIGTGGHVVLGAELGCDVYLGTIKNMVTIDGLLNIRHRIGLSAHETRSASYQLLLTMVLMHNSLGMLLRAKNILADSFPLINALTQPVNVAPGNATDFALALCASYRWIHTRLSYRFAHSESETVAPLIEWPANQIAISRLDYAQTESPLDPEASLIYNTFDPAVHSSMVTGGLSEENILFQAAATPAQSTHTLGVTLAGMPFVAP